MKKLAPGVYRLPDGKIRAFVRVEGRLRSKRFPKTDPVQKAKDWRTSERTKHETPADETDPDAPATFAQDVATYLAAVSSMPGYGERKRHLELWLAALGSSRQRSTVTATEIQTVLHAWRLTLGPATCNKRRTALLALWHRLDGRSGKNPVREVRRFPEPPEEARGVDYATLRRIFKAMPDSATKIRLEVMAYTGLRPIQLRTLQPADWNRQAHTLTIPATRKGAGTKRQTVPLLKDAERALRLFDREKLWKTSFGSAPMARVWRRALKRVHITRRIVPYDLRHSFGTAAYQATGDLRAVQTLLAHSAIRMTQRYTLGAVEARQQAAIDALGQALQRRKSPRKVTKKVTAPRTRRPIA